jgi:hypothetical protein
MRPCPFVRVLRNFTFTLALGAFAVAPSNASTIWDWAYSGSGITANGTFTTADTPNEIGGYLITGITGTRNGVAITGLQPAGTPIPGNEPFNVDNLVFLGPGPQLTSGGFGYSMADGTYSNPFYAGFLPTPGYLEFFSVPPFTPGMPGPEDTELPIGFSAAPVTTGEPATVGLVLCILAVLSLPVLSRSLVPRSG